MLYDMHGAWEKVNLFLNMFTNNLVPWWIDFYDEAYQKVHLKCNLIFAKLQVTGHNAPLYYAQNSTGANRELTAQFAVEYFIEHVNFDYFAKKTTK